MLSKHFADQVAGMSPVGAHNPMAGESSLPSLFDER